MADDPDPSQLWRIGRQVLWECGHERYEIFRERHRTEDLEAAIRYVRLAIEVTKEKDVTYVSMLHRLGKLISQRYEHLEQDEDIEEAASLLRSAIEMAPENHVELAEWLNDAVIAFGYCYESNKRLVDIETSVEMLKKGIEIRPQSRPDLEPMLTQNLARNLFILQSAKPCKESREECFQLIKQAFEQTPENDPCFAVRLLNLSTSLQLQFMKEGRTKDLEEAVGMARKVLTLVPQESLEYSSMLISLSNQICYLSLQSQRPDNLNEAVEVSRKAIEVMPEDHHLFPQQLLILSETLSNRFKRLGVINDLEEAISVAQKSVQIVDEDALNYTGQLTQLGYLLSQRYHVSGKIEDLQTSIEILYRSLRFIQREDSMFLQLLLFLATALGHRYQCFKKRRDLEEAIGLARQASVCESTSVFGRVRGCIELLRLLQRKEDFDAAYTTSLEAITMVPYLYGMFLAQVDQQYAASRFPGLASIASALALQTGKAPEIALEVLEQGRAVTFGLLIDDRSYTSELRDLKPNLYSEYESLRVEINKPMENDFNKSAPTTSLNKREKAISKLEKCIRNIQQLPGFEHFCRRSTARQMQRYSEGGTIVMVNVSSLRSDAIIITPGAVTALPLSGLYAETAENWINQNLTTFSIEDRGRKNKNYLRFLSWLWHQCVKPILQKLQYYVQAIELQAENDLPRVWWIGTGLASQFPFHAAGDVSTGRTEAACYHVVSSYASTIKALQHARRTAKITAEWSATVISMPSTPGMDSFLETKRETSEVRASIESLMHVVSLDYPNVEDTLKHLRNCSIVHFACHGVSDPDDPSRSRLILQTKKTESGEPQQDPLSVSDIAEIHLSHAQIAYLSACSTAQNKVKELSHEALHIVSAFQVAGFRHVIGCLWPSDDEVCQEVAKSFYAELSQGGIAAFENDRAIALALHNAVLKIRESSKYAKQPLLWAQYVHYGA